ncbi:hypothetical protein RR07_19870, partial [Acinetobacter baumannii]
IVIFVSNKSTISINHSTNIIVWEAINSRYFVIINRHIFLQNEKLKHIDNILFILALVYLCKL